MANSLFCSRKLKKAGISQLGKLEETVIEVREIYTAGKFLPGDTMGHRG